MQDSMIPSEISRRLLAPIGVVSVERIPPGMSGALVFRCQLKDGQQRVLRRWPIGTAAERVAELAQVIRHSRNNGCELTPQLYPIGSAGETFVVHQAACWQWMQWMPGAPPPADCELNQIERGAGAIARFHASVADLGVVIQPADAVTARLRRVRALKPRIEQIMAMGPRDAFSALDPVVAAALYRARQLLIWRWDEIAHEITRSLEIYQNEPLHTQFVLRDIHRENALFLDGQPSGLVDFDAVRIDSPWTDLARWTGSFLAGPHEIFQIWDAAMAGFCREHPLNSGPEMEFGQKLAKAFCFATNWIGLANWLDWLLIEHRTFEAAPQAVAGRIDQLRQLAELGS